MPAEFTRELCGFRANGNPNTSDNSDRLSIELGRELFAQLGVPTTQAGDPDPGARLEEAVVADLTSRRNDLTIRRSRSAMEFEQYAHLSVFPRFRRLHTSPSEKVRALLRLTEQASTSPLAHRIHVELQAILQATELEDELTDTLLANMPEESLLNIDITCGESRPGHSDYLHIALSSKWSLRTDRAQDCVSQGSKLASQRRGRMPHYAVVTIEPRPAMLKILADGSGAIDCVYHLDLPALASAIDVVRERRSAGWGPGATFDRLIRQRRLRDYSELVDAVNVIPM